VAEAPIVHNHKRRDILTSSKATRKKIIFEVLAVLAGFALAFIPPPPGLPRRSTGKTVYILDEPTTGLHTDDVKKLIEILQKFVDAGNTVIVIEHNLDVIKTADHIIDLGPEGGDGGGTVVCCGTPEEVAECKASFTGQYLKKLLIKK